VTATTPSPCTTPVSSPVLRQAILVPHCDSPGWLEEDFLGRGRPNRTNAYGAATTKALLEAGSFSVLEAVSLADDDSGPGWVWFTAQRPGAAGQGRA
jgi:hypothetical protein